MPTGKTQLKNCLNRNGGLCMYKCIKYIFAVAGLPFTLHVTPDGLTEIENGQPVRFNVEVRDKADNPTSQPKLNITCKVRATSSL